MSRRTEIEWRHERRIYRHHAHFAVALPPRRRLSRPIIVAGRTRASLTEKQLDAWKARVLNTVLAVKFVCKSQVFPLHFMLIQLRVPNVLLSFPTIKVIVSKYLFNKYAYWITHRYSFFFYPAPFRSGIVVRVGVLQYYLEILFFHSVLVTSSDYKAMGFVWVFSRISDLIVQNLFGW